MERNQPVPKFSSFKPVKRDVADEPSREIIKLDEESKRSKDKKEKKSKKLKKNKEKKKSSRYSESEDEYSDGYRRNREKKRSSRDKYSESEDDIDRYNDRKLVRRRKERERERSLPEPKFTFPSYLTTEYGLYLDTVPEKDPTYSFKRVPYYKRFGGGRVLGLPQDLRIQNSKSLQTYDGIPVLTITKYKPKTKGDKELRYTSVTTTTPSVYLHGQPLDELRQHHFLSNTDTSDELSLIKDDTDGTESYQPQSSTNNDPNATAANNLIEQTIGTKTKNYESQLKLNPQDVDLWIEYINYQEEAYKLRSTYSGKLTLAARIEIQLSMYQRAFASNSNSEKLHLEYLKCGKPLWSSDLFVSKWEATLKLMPDSKLLWQQYLNLNLTQLSLFNFDTLLAKFEFCMDTLNTHALALKDPSEIEPTLIFILGRLVYFLREAGYVERSIATFQAMVELNFFIPGSLKAIALPYQLESLARFWVKGFPKFGEPGSTGWESYHKLTTFPNLGILEPTGDIAEPDYQPDKLDWTDKEFHQPLLPLSVYCNEGGLLGADPYRTVFFDELEPFLFNLTTPHTRQMFLEMMYRFLVYPTFNVPTSNFDQVDGFDFQLLDGFTHQLHTPESSTSANEMEEIDSDFISLNIKENEASTTNPFEKLLSSEVNDLDTIEYGICPYETNHLLKQATDPNLKLIQLNPNLYANEYLQFLVSGLNRINKKINSQYSSCNTWFVTDPNSFLRLQFALQNFEKNEQIRNREIRRLLKDNESSKQLFIDYANHLYIKGDLQGMRKVFKATLESLEREGDTLGELVASWSLIEMQVGLDQLPSVLDQLFLNYVTNQPIQLDDLSQVIDLEKLGKSFVTKLETVTKRNHNHPKGYFYFHLIYAIFLYRRNGLERLCVHLVAILPHLTNISAHLTELLLTRILPIVFNPVLQDGNFGYQPKLLRSMLQAALPYFPYNSTVLKLFYKLEKKLKVENRFNRYITHTVVNKEGDNSMKLVLNRFVTDTQTNRYLKTNTFHKLIQLLDHANGHPNLWIRYLWHTMKTGSFDAMRLVATQALTNNPYSKGVYFAVVQLTQEWNLKEDSIRLMVEKGIRVTYQFSED